MDADKYHTSFNSRVRIGLVTYQSSSKEESANNSDDSDSLNNKFDKYVADRSGLNTLRINMLSLLEKPVTASKRLVHAHKLRSSS